MKTSKTMTISSRMLGFGGREGANRQISVPNLFGRREKEHRHLEVSSEEASEGILNRKRWESTPAIRGAGVSGRGGGDG